MKKLYFAYWIAIAGNFLYSLDLVSSANSNQNSNLTTSKDFIYSFPESVINIIQTYLSGPQSTNTITHILLGNPNDRTGSAYGMAKIVTPHSGNKFEIHQLQKNMYGREWLQRYNWHYPFDKAPESNGFDTTLPAWDTAVEVNEEALTTFGPSIIPTSTSDNPRSIEWLKDRNLLFVVDGNRITVHTLVPSKEYQEILSRSFLNPTAPLPKHKLKKNSVQPFDKVFADQAIAKFINEPTIAAFCEHYQTETNPFLAALVHRMPLAPFLPKK